jgi:hypothetical protein
MFDGLTDRKTDPEIVHRVLQTICIHFIKSELSFASTWATRFQLWQININFGDRISTFVTQFQLW